MNQPDPARIEKIIANYQPKRKAAFEAIRPWLNMIQGLRNKGASYDDIAEILKQEGVRTSDTTVRKFCREALSETQAKKSRRRHKSSMQTSPPPADGPFQTPTHPDQKPSAAPSAPARERTPGPRIANVEFIEEPKI